MNPDDHPGTALRYKDKEIYPNIYDGYGCFAQNGMMIFVAPVPETDGYWPYPQLFAVRGADLPMVLSERLLRQPLSFTSGTVPFAVHDLLFTNDHFRVQFEQGTNILTHEFTWPDVKGFIDEGDGSARLVHSSITDYRVLP